MLGKRYIRIIMQKSTSRIKFVRFLRVFEGFRAIKTNNFNINLLERLRMEIRDHTLRIINRKISLDIIIY